MELWMHPIRGYDFVMLLPMTFRQLEAVIARIVERISPEEIWLFGSQAEGRARPDSDYDLLAIMPDSTPAEILDPVAAWSIVRGLGVPVDLIPCTRSVFEQERLELDSLPRAAFLRGKKIYERAARLPSPSVSISKKRKRVKG